ncbi:MAG: UDP-N-acetylmuramoyl-L-alanyl-D-glutamate--2,6-diaminopimelate ligase [Proteobacteria bacterium]|nr:UDP-N-acetylmuramoyl-L-alanyl-D-glutamate--2,6-diaminopimelate ligase [Pseudomonadota bacterium]MBU1686326.1 UDP-N-acetylmuramoyl-L-alanyl-D-glutamate--2,6-diaminopimelate ligase [Pseudomonadota bacterium]
MISEGKLHGPSLGELLGEIGQDKKRKGIVTGVAIDSREVRPGNIFVALAGTQTDGRDHIGDAVARGCLAVIVEKRVRLPEASKGVALVVVSDSRLVAARLAAAYYGHPERSLHLIGITGTNGKTTSTYLLEEVLCAAGHRPGVIGTINYRFGDQVWPAPLTTPDPVSLFRLLGQMAKGGATHVIMEVSSHALVQGRLAGLLFDVVLFTNLSRDHLDFHLDMERYFQAKKKLFTEYLKDGASAVIVLSSEEREATESESGHWGSRLRDELKASNDFFPPEKARCNLVTCGLNEGELRVLRYRSTLDGIDLELGVPENIYTHCRSGLVGDFNLQNILGVAGVARSLDIDGESFGQGISAMPMVPGRVERVLGSGTGERCRVFVDYAHTPDALERVLVSLKRLTGGRVILVFGCGGDRDRGKRPLMGAIAARLADVVLLTSDNPRSEEPSSILADIEQGMVAKAGNHGTPVFSRGRAEWLLRSGGRGYDLMGSRREAIGTAIRFAGVDDVLLISGKGHEDYQIIGDRRLSFDDRVEAARHLLVVNW